MAAVLLGAVFLLTSGGGDFAPPLPAASQVVEQQQQLGEEQRADLQQQLEELQAQLAANADDVEALEGVAVVQFRLGQYGEAEKLLARLAEAKPGDGEVLRVLAEAQAAQAEWGASVATYRKAWEADGRSSLEVLQGWAGACGRVRGWPVGAAGSCCWVVRLAQQGPRLWPYPGPAMPWPPRSTLHPARSRPGGRRQGGGCGGGGGRGGGRWRQQWHRRGGACAAVWQDVRAVAGAHT